MESVGIENILKVTGLSCDDLINKLIQYKTSSRRDDLDIDSVNNASNFIEQLTNASNNNSAIKDALNDKSITDRVNALIDRSNLVSKKNESEETSKSVSDAAIHNVIQPNSSESNFSKDDSFKEESTNVESSSSTDTEEVRCTIMEKLELLRKKRKNEKFVNVANSAKTFQIKKNSSLTLQDAKSSQLKVNESNVLNSKRQTINLEDVLLNNESDIKIVEVCSGSDIIVLDDDDDETDVKSSVTTKKSNHLENVPNIKINIKSKEDTEFDKTTILEDKLDLIKPTKTSDIKKIKGWKNKKFDMPSNSNKVISESKKSKDMEKSDNVNPFLSSDLDGFLQNAMLDISFDIPKLNSENTLKNDQDLYVKPVDVHRETIRSSTKFVRKPRTVAEKRRAESMLNANMFKTETFERNSFVNYNGKKLKILSNNPSKLCNIKEVVKPKIKRKLLEEPQKKAPQDLKKSLLNSLKTDLQNTVRYSPGPLSRKTNLQLLCHKNKYKTIIKKLPLVTLEVKPQIGKKLCPNIEPYVKYETYVITEDRLEFALSVLQSKNNEENKIFNFTVPYANNQDVIKLYKRIYVLPFISDSSKKDVPNVDDVVKNVVNDMLNYVNLKEISESLIKDDDYMNNNKKDEPAETKDIHDSSGNFEVIVNKKSPKNSKTSLELKRLNVKLIEVDIEHESEAESEDCKELSCQLGCVCKSLRSYHHTKDHCGNVDCMFQCTCNYSMKTLNSLDTKILLPPGTNLFSNGTVNDLDNHVKRDLAKVEKEFTQTVIQSKNQTIIVGNNLERKKRLSKAPKKLEDFIHPNNMYIDLKKYYKIQDCFVKLCKLDLSHILPFCMNHVVYNCDCVSRKKVEITTNINKSPVIKKTTKVLTKPKPIRNKNIPPTKQMRNVTIECVNTFEPISIHEFKEIEEPSKKKRKQTFHDIRRSPILMEEVKEPALQRRKKPTRDIVIPQTTKRAEFFDGINDNTQFLLNNTEFYTAELLKLLKKKYGDNRKFRMIPWNWFTENYYKNNLFIWCPIGNTRRILITPDKNPPEKDMVNVRTRNDLSDTLDFLKWLRKGIVPPDKNPENLHIVVVSTDENKCWEIFGISNISSRKSLTDHNSEYLIEKAEFAKLKLYSSDKEDKTVYLVSLPPTMKFVKWKKVPLRSNFASILLKKFNVHVKYNVLCLMAKDAFKYKKTKILRAPLHHSSIDNTYGVYAVPEYDNCVFIGPYLMHENVDFETLRYVNRELVSTDIVQQMLNKTVETKAAWLYNRIIFTYMFKPISRKYQDELLYNRRSINEDDDSDCEIVSEIMKKNRDLRHITCSLNNDVTFYEDKQDKCNKKPLYIISPNVPSLGYVDAFVTEFSDFIIVWPEHEPPKVFSSESKGLKWLKMYLDTFLIPLPLSFTINLKLTDVKPKNRTNLRLSQLQCFPFVGSLGVILEIEEPMKKYFVQRKFFTEAEIAECIQYRQQNILLVECSQIYNELSMPQNFKFSTINDFVDYLRDLVHKERSIELEAIKEQTSLRQKKLELQNKIIAFRKKAQQMLIKKNKLMEKQRRNNALNQLKENEEIQIEAVGNSSKEKLKNIINDDEVICIDSDDETVTITPTKTTPTTPTQPTKSVLAVSNGKSITIPSDKLKPIFSPSKKVQTNVAVTTLNNSIPSPMLSVKRQFKKINIQSNDCFLPLVSNTGDLGNKFNNEAINTLFDKIPAADDKLSTNSNVKEKADVSIKEIDRVLYRSTIIGGKLVNLKLYPTKK